MAKLHFKYGAMNSGKTTMLLQTTYNYEERNQKVKILKSAVDTKGDENIISRIGASRKVDYLIKPDDKILEILKKELNNLDCILVDEVQFLTKSQIDDLFFIAKLHNIPVIGFGLKTDFRSNLFEGSKRLIELADELLEIPTICRCGKKARFNARKINDKFTLLGNSIEIDDQTDISYESLCGKCYIEKVLNGEK